MTRATWLRVVQASVVCILALAFAREMIIVWGVPDPDLLDPFADANVYRAAAERLNAGHPLYELSPGDRPVLILPSFTAPLLSPPLIAVLWRPIAALPFGFELWNLACAAALLGTVSYLVLRVGMLATVLAAALSLPIGEQLVAGNVAAFFPGLFVVTWTHRRDPRVGVIVSVVTALKLTPGVLGGWFLGLHRGAAVRWLVAGAISSGILSLVGAGLGAFVAYPGVLGSTAPSGISLSALTGIAWMSPAVLVAGTVASTLLWRWPRLSFAVCIATIVAGSPALYFSTLVLLLAVLAPLIPETEQSPRSDVAARNPEGGPAGLRGWSDPSAPDASARRGAPRPPAGS